MELEINERRVLLKGLVNICFIVEDSILSENQIAIEDIRTIVDNSENKLEDKMESLEELNQIELIKMKSWFVKTTSIMLFTVILVAGVSYIFLNNGEGGIFDKAAPLINIIKTAFGL